MLILGTMLVRQRNTKVLSNFWLMHWVGNSTCYNPNYDYLRGQLERPIHVFKDFIEMKDMKALDKNSWAYFQYMAYLARVLEMGNVSLLLELDAMEIYACIWRVAATRWPFFAIPGEEMKAAINKKSCY